MKTIDIKKLSASELAELKKQMADQEKEAKDAREKARKKYETERDTIVKELLKEARSIEKTLSTFKQYSVKQVQAFREWMLEYGDIRGGEKNKGSFEIRSNDDLMKVIVSSQVNKDFDERAELAEKHLRAFLDTFIKQRDKDMYTFITTLLERNSKTGKLDISNINRLYKIEDKFDNEDWKKALELFKESYQERSTALYVRFYERATTEGAWDMISLSYSSIK